MSTKLVAGFALGCALGFGIAFVALRSDRAHNPPPSGEIGPRLTEILKGPDPLRRVMEFTTLLSTLSPTDAPAVVEAFETAPIDGGDPEPALFGMWWARFDPTAALLWTNSSWRAQSQTVTAAVFRSWAHSDPELAIGAARGLTFMTHQEVAIDAAIVGWDESGKPGLIEAIMTLRDIDRQPLLASVARRRVVILGPEGAFRWVESLSATPRLQQQMAERVASTAAESKQGAPFAAAWATPKVRSDERLSNLPRRIATRWVAHDPEAAMAWLATLPAGADRDDGVGEAFGDWTRYGKDAALAWIEAIELERWNEPAFAVYARIIAEERPEEAIELTQRISDVHMRESNLILIGRAWLKKDRAAAEAWLAQPGVPERVRRLSFTGGRGADPARERTQAQAAPDAMTGAVPN